VVTEIVEEKLVVEQEVSEIINAESEMAEAAVPPKPGFFKRVGSSVSKIFSRDKAVEVPEKMREAETEVVVGGEPDAIVEETYDIKSGVAEASESEMKAEQEIAEVIEIAEAVETVDAIDDSVTNAFTFGDGKCEVQNEQRHECGSHT
jgi:predicted transcriptional regulator